MSQDKEIAVADKRKVDTNIHQELRSGNWFVPAADIYETPDKLVLVMDMPGCYFDERARVTNTGAGSAFERAMEAFAVAYADQTAADWEALKAAIADGTVEAEPGRHASTSAFGGSWRPT